MHFCADTNRVLDQIGPLSGMDWLEQVVAVFEVNHISAPTDMDFFPRSGLCCFLKDDLYNCVVPRLGWHLLHSSTLLLMGIEVYVRGRGLSHFMPNHSAMCTRWFFAAYSISLLQRACLFLGKTTYPAALGTTVPAEDLYF